MSYCRCCCPQLRCHVMPSCYHPDHFPNNPHRSLATALDDKTSQILSFHSKLSQSLGKTLARKDSYDDLDEDAPNGNAETTEAPTVGAHLGDQVNTGPIDNDNDSGSVGSHHDNDKANTHRSLSVPPAAVADKSSKAPTYQAEVTLSVPMHLQNM